MRHKILQRNRPIHHLSRVHSINVPTHWTYDEYDTTADLAQGDILARTGGLVDLISRVHAYYSDEKYLGFLVVTQTCDLVRRNNKCKADHIALAVIQSLDGLLSRFMDEAAGTGVPGVYLNESRTRAHQLLERILNQNEQALGLFYLHADSDAGVAEASIALLRITISFRAEHYETLMAARQGRLRSEFSNKLGWLLGNLYARVASPDWTDQPSGDRQLRELINSMLSKGEWVPATWVTAAKKAGVRLDGLDTEVATEILRQHAPDAPKETAIRRVREIAMDLFGEEQKSAVAKLASRLHNDQVFTASCRRP